MPAPCDTSTLHPRDVPDDVVERPKRLAERESTSVTAVAVRKPSEATRDVDDPALLAALPDPAAPTSVIVGALDAERAAC